MAIISATSHRISIAPVIDNKSILVFNLTTDSSAAGPQDTHLRGQLSCTAGYCNAIEFKRYGSNGRVSVRWQVIEFNASSLVSVQRGIETQLSMAANTNMPPQKIVKTEVDRTKSFVLLSELVHGSVSDADDFTRGQINAAGDLVLTVGNKKNSASQAEIAWQVVEYQQAEVQSGNIRFSMSDASKTAKIKTVDLSKSWLVYNYYSSGTGGLSLNPICQNLVSGAIASPTRLQFNRGCANKNGEVYLSWFLIEFSDKTRIQHDVLSFSATRSRQTVTLDHAIHVNCAVTSAGYHQRGGQSTAMTDHTASAWFNAELNTNGTGTHLTLLRGQTNNAIAELGWFVLAFEGCGSASMAKPQDYGDLPLSGVAPDGKHRNRYGIASHVLVRGVYLGFANPDADIASQFSLNTINSINASGDDVKGSDDDDILSIPPLAQGKTASFIFFVAGKDGYLQGWLDFNGNGLFDENEQIATNLQDDGMGDDGKAGDGIIVFKVAIPENTIIQRTYARFRWSTRRNLKATAMAMDGEVEDYALTITASATTLAKAKDNSQNTSESVNATNSVLEVENTLDHIADKTIDNEIEEDQVQDTVIKPQGVVVQGRVYKDSNVDGTNNAKEAGVSGLPVVLLDVINHTCISTRTDAKGYYRFATVLKGEYQLYEASREKVPVPKKCGIAYAKDPARYRSTTVNVLPQFEVAEIDIMGKDFGDVKAPLFTANRSSKLLAGNETFYKHRFTSQSSGVVGFTSTDNNPATSGWLSVLYHDTNCNGVLDNAEKSIGLNSELVTSVNQTICILNKVHAPNNAPTDEKYRNVITAHFDFEHVLAETMQLTVTDKSKIFVTNDSQNEPRLELKKTVENLTEGTAETDTLSQALSGDVLQYRIYYSNAGLGEITELVINDVIPDVTRLNAAPVCEKPLPSGLTDCSSAVNGRELHWQFPESGSLQSGQHGVVSYQVKVE